MDMSCFVLARVNRIISVRRNRCMHGLGCLAPIKVLQQGPDSVRSNLSSDDRKWC